MYKKKKSRGKKVNRTISPAKLRRRAVTKNYFRGGKNL